MKTSVKNMYFKTRIFISLVLVFILAAAFFITKSGKEVKDGNELVAGKQYVCSMHPQVIRNEPGDCPICGMFLIELIPHDKNSFDSTLTDVVLPVNGSVKGRVRTIRPEQTELPIIIEASGVLNFDPAGIKTISARFGGYVEKSLVKYQFQYIRKGQKIFEIYSPDVYAERWNYVKLLQAFPDREEVTREALEWLNMLGLSKGQIDSLKSANIPDYHLAVYCPEEGYAVSRDFDPASFESAGSGASGLTSGVIVQKGEPLFKLLDVRSLRVDLNVRIEDASLLSSGQSVILTDPNDPGRQYSAVTGLIEPFNDGYFQTVRVFLEEPFKERPLLRGQKLSGRIFAGSHNALWIPASAVAWTGMHHSVFVLRDNKFEAVEVRTGMRLNDKVEILYGIENDSDIAEKALLLVDSDSFISMK